MGGTDGFQQVHPFILQETCLEKPKAPRMGFGSTQPWMTLCGSKLGLTSQPTASQEIITGPEVPHQARLGAALPSRYTSNA